MPADKSDRCILIVEDDSALRWGLSRLFESDGFKTETAADGESALEFLADVKRHFALVILDLMLPGIDGLDVLKHLRKHRDQLPVLVLSAKGRVDDKVELLDAGADDYLTKPFENDELRARVRTLLKRFEKTADTKIEAGSLAIDTDARRVTRNGEAIHLSPTEMAILDFLIERAGKAVSREAIVDRVWDLDPPESSRVVDYHVLQLRRKLEDDPSSPRHIVTEPGFGYRFDS
ncbi:MAG: response regulator transcription factor [Planctomycetota bacterium]